MQDRRKTSDKYTSPQILAGAVLQAEEAHSRERMHARGGALTPEVLAAAQEAPLPAVLAGVIAHEQQGGAPFPQRGGGALAGRRRRCDVVQPAAVARPPLSVWWSLTHNQFQNCKHLLLNLMISVPAAGRSTISHHAQLGGQGHWF